jgi:hypothetical protein
MIISVVVCRLGAVDVGVDAVFGEDAIEIIFAAVASVGDEQMGAYDFIVVGAGSQIPVGESFRACAIIEAEKGQVGGIEDDLTLEQSFGHSVFLIEG